MELVLREVAAGFSGSQASSGSVGVVFHLFQSVIAVRGPVFHAVTARAPISPLASPKSVQS